MGQEVKERGSTLRYESRWRLKMVINGFGAVCTAIVMLVFAVTKFAEGAWIVLLLMPLLVFVFSRIHHHYLDLAARLSLERYGEPPRILRQCVIIPLSGVHRGTSRPCAMRVRCRMTSRPCMSPSILLRPKRCGRNGSCGGRCAPGHS